MPTAVNAQAVPPADRPDHLPFNTLGLSLEVLKAVAQLGFEEASPIQSTAIPVLMTGCDVVGQSQTGSGKTAAFAIPAIERVDLANKAVQVLILTPTRELATQVADEVHKLAAFKRGLASVPIYGGASYERQFSELRRGVHIVVGTPGRLMDHMNRGTLNLGQLKMVILDEADRMLDMGFRDDIQAILDAAPKERQTVFFSATLSSEIKALINKHARNPKLVAITSKAVDAPQVEQMYYEVRHHAKFEALVRLLDFLEFKNGVIFCNTQRTVDDLADALMGRGYAADRLHGGIAQAQRSRVMNGFKQGNFDFLVATDVAARGIDVNDLEMVVNFDLPYDAEDYVHRIGRTGRAGRKGRAITFVSGSEIYKLQHIERFTKSKIRRETVPSIEAVEGKRADAMFERVRGVLESGEFMPHTAFLDRLLEQGYSATDVASVLLGQLMGSSPAPEAAGREAARPAPVGKPVAAAPPESPTRGWVAPRPSAAPVSVPALGKARPAASAGPLSASAPMAPPAAKEMPAKKKTPKPITPEPVALDSTEPLDRPDTLPKATHGKQWMCLNIGREDGLTPPQLVDLIIGDSGAAKRMVGVIKFDQGQSFVEIEREAMPDVLVRLSATMFKGRKLQARSLYAKAFKKKP